MFEVNRKWVEEVRYKETRGRKKGPLKPTLDDTPYSCTQKISCLDVGLSYNT